MRKKIVAGNWKMNKNLEEGLQLTSEVVNMVKDEVSGQVEVVLCTPFVHLSPIAKLLGGNKKVMLGAQNCSEHASGAYTGEVSADMLKSVGVQFVIVGHSERREYFGETDSLFAKKVDAVLGAGLTPIYCCGEKLEVREANRHVQLVKDQISEALFHLSAEAVQKVVIAYEPVWAIGTGKTASSAQAQEMHAEIRAHLASKYGKAVAEEITIQYGGSVKPDNAAEIFAQPDVDGGLIGGASLKSRDFVDIVKAIK